MRTSNPTLNDNTFRGEGIALGEPMTLTGTVNKTGILLLLAMGSAAWSWNLTTRSPEQALGLAIAGLIGGLIFALVTTFKKSWAPVTAPIYALAEGLVLGCLSEIFDKRYPGMVIAAVTLTFGTLLALLVLYRARVIQVTDKFRLGVVAATGGIAFFYLLTFILGFFGIRFSAIYGSGLIGIGFSIFVVIIAALNLVLDFDFIETGADVGAPKYMEWYGGFALLVTLVWLYLEILRLLAKMRGRR
ncbi:MAG TPA: Bax inhibitor-1/YccA family protein [Candidatus Angelobacter sp.]